jgi:hypothetical protein
MPWRHKGRLEVKIHPFLNLVIDAGALADLLLGKNPDTY